MENASKALLIAGGVLLAVLVLSLFGLLLSNISSNQMAQEKTKQAEQLKEFNQQWEAYNKKALYGTDIITVVNKAIQNNKSVVATNEDDKFYVNVKINYKGNIFKTKITKLNLITNELKEVSYVPSSATGSMEIHKDTIKLSGITELGRWQQEDGILKMDNKIVKAFEHIHDYKEEYIDETNHEIYYIDSAFKVFKTTLFRCTGIEYKDGRVHEIHFEIR